MEWVVFVKLTCYFWEWTSLKYALHNSFNLPEVVLELVDECISKLCLPKYRFVQDGRKDVVSRTRMLALKRTVDVRPALVDVPLTKAKPSLAWRMKNPNVTQATSNTFLALTRDPFTSCLLSFCSSLRTLDIGQGDKVSRGGDSVKQWHEWSDTMVYILTSASRSSLWILE